MTEDEFRKNLESCSRQCLIDMMVIQWRGLGEFVEQFKMVPEKSTPATGGKESKHE